MNYPTETRFCDADGQFVIFRNWESREIGREKIGNSAHALGVAERITKEIEAARRPWLVTRSDYYAIRLGGRVPEISTVQGIYHAHESHVKQAKKDKREIPAAVKADYPKIFKN